jgi:hypothetical protein
MHPLNYIFAYHIDSTTLADGDYELIPEQEVEISEDPGNVVGNLTEAPNQSSKNFDTPTPNPIQEGNPQTLTAIFATLQLYLFIYVYLCIYVSRDYFETLVAYS